jgi:hypothetical protein
MATLLVHFISDFLRDVGTTAGNFGENLRCAVLLDDQVALKNYGLNNAQVGVLQSRDREKILKQLSDEIGAVMNELDAAPGTGLLYPSGSVEVREVKLLWSSGNDRKIVIRGTAFATDAVVEFVPIGGGGKTNGTVERRACDTDAWQRLYVSVTLPAGAYDVTVRRPSNTSNDHKPLTI